MPDANPIEQLQRRLVELGCPAKAVRRIVRETAEHFEDLLRAALSQGVPDVEAAARATEQLGDPKTLAERHIEALRNSTWWGRHPFWGFGVLPLGIMVQLFLVFWMKNAGEMPGAAISPFLGSEPGRSFLLRYLAFEGAFLVVTAFLTLFFCWQARRCMLKRRWTIVMVGLLCAHGFFLHFQPSTDKLFVLEASQRAITDDPRMWALLSAAYPPSTGADRRINTQLITPLFKLTIEHQAEWQLLMMRTPLPDPWGSEWRAQTVSFQLHGHWANNNLWGMSRGWVDAFPSDGSSHVELMQGVQWTLPVLVASYALSFNDPGILHLLNVIMPLLIVAAMQAWQRWKGKRLLRETALGHTQPVGAS